MVGQHLQTVGRNPVAGELARGPVAGSHEAVHGVEHERLVQREPGGVGRGLGQRAAAVEHHPGQRVAAPAAKARAAVARGHADRAEEAQVVEMEHHARPGRPCGRQAAGAEQRQHVVHVHHVGREGAHGIGQALLAVSAAEQGGRRPHPAHLAGAPLHQGVLHPGRAQRAQLQLHGPLLASLDAVAVVDHKYARRTGHRPDHPIPRARGEHGAVLARSTIGLRSSRRCRDYPSGR